MKSSTLPYLGPLKKANHLLSALLTNFLTILHSSFAKLSLLTVLQVSPLHPHPPKSNTFSYLLKQRTVRCTSKLPVSFDCHLVVVMCVFNPSSSSDQVPEKDFYKKKIITKWQDEEYVCIRHLLWRPWARKYNLFVLKWHIMLTCINHGTSHLLNHEIDFRITLDFYTYELLRHNFLSYYGRNVSFKSRLIL